MERFGPEAVKRRRLARAKRAWNAHRKREAVWGLIRAASNPGCGRCGGFPGAVNLRPVDPEDCRLLFGPAAAAGEKFCDLLRRIQAGEVKFECWHCHRIRYFLDTPAPSIETVRALEAELRDTGGRAEAEKFARRAAKARRRRYRKRPGALAAVYQAVEDNPGAATGVILGVARGNRTRTWKLLHELRAEGRVRAERGVKSTLHWFPAVPGTAGTGRLEP